MHIKMDLVVKTHLQSRTTGQGAPELHQGARDLVTHGGMALVVMNRRSGVVVSTVVGPGGSGGGSGRGRSRSTTSSGATATKKSGLQTRTGTSSAVATATGNAAASGARIPEGAIIGVAALGFAALLL